ncbi:MAG: copper chaperone PCu(A)C [Burkholderiaceae bacterium]
MKSIAFSLIIMSATGLSIAQNVDIKDAWARTSVQGQKATGAFMTLIAKDGAKLVGVSTPVAGVAEVHEMKMDGDIMRMRAVTGGLDLPAGKAVELKPSSYHIMLMDLKAALPKDTTVPLTLVFKDAKGVQSKIELKVPVSTAAPRATSAGGAMQMDQHKH